MKRISLNNVSWIYILESVGSAFDEQGAVYPLLANGEVDVDNPTPIEEGSDEWFNALSDEDRQTIWDVLKYDASHTDDLPK